MHGKGQHYGLHVLVCNILIFFIRSCMLFFLQCTVWKEIYINFAVVAIGSLLASKVACMQLFSHQNLQQFILMWVYKFQEFSSGCIKDSRRCRRYFVSYLLMSIWFIYRMMWACTELDDCNSYRMMYRFIVPNILGPHNKMSCINFSTRAWNKAAHLTGQSFHDINGSIVFAMSSILVTSFQWKELVLCAVKVRKKCGIPKFSIIANNSCKCDLCQRGGPWMDDGRLYFVICCNTSCFVMCGYCSIICFISLSKHIF